MAFAQRSRGRSPQGDRGAAGRNRELGGEPDGSAAELGPEADPEQVARQICLSQLERAPRTRAELAAVLARRGVPEEAASVVLSRFADVGLIDDALFAQLWVSSRHRGKGLAGRALSQELRRKGVDDQVAAEAVGALDPDEELATARSLVQRRLRVTAGLPPEARVRRLAGLLARKGYPAGLAFRVVREALVQEGAEVDVPSDSLAGLDS